MKVTGNTQDINKKASERSRTLSYLYSYYPDTSDKFKYQITLLHTIVEASKKHRNNVRWAKCCHCIERRVGSGSLNHPEEEMITMKDLMAQENIKNEEDMFSYMKKNLPRNDKDEILLPQINMKHPDTIPVKSEADILREELAKANDEKELMKATIEVMKQQDNASQLTISSLHKYTRLLEEKLEDAQIDK